MNIVLGPFVLSQLFVMFTAKRVILHVDFLDDKMVLCTCM